MTFKQPNRIWQILILVLCTGLALPIPARAAIQEIRVLATGVDESSSKAAALALDYAKKRAVYLVARKMQVLNASSKVAALSDEQFSEIVRGATVLQTKRINDVTYADVSVTIVNEALRKALNIADPVGIDMADTPTQGVLVMPVLMDKEKSRPYLWDKENLTMDPVRTEVMHQARGAVIVPAGDFDDRRLVDYQNVLDVKASELDPMFKRYGVEEIIIAIITPGAEGTSEPTDILLRRLYPAPKESRTEQVTLKPASAAATLNERLAQAAGAIGTTAAQIASATSQLQQDKLKTATAVPINFHYATARDLASMQEAVRSAPGVLQLEMPNITLGDMHGTLYLSGDKDAVRKALAKQAFIVKDEAGGWGISIH